MRTEFLGRNAPEAWAVAQGGLLTAAAPRVDLSRRITLEPQRVTVDEVASAVEQGWVAGADWRRKLEGLSASVGLSVPGQLALAAAIIDAGQLDDGLRRLRALAETSDATAGWAAYLLGVQSADQRWLERATERLPDRAETWLALDSVLAQRQRHMERSQLWTRAPKALGARDDVRVALGVEVSNPVGVEVGVRVDEGVQARVGVALLTAQLPPPRKQ